MTTEAEPAVRTRKVAKTATIYVVALGHLYLKQDQSSVKALIGGRYDVDVPDEPQLEHRWVIPSGEDDVGTFCTETDQGAFPVTTLIV